MSATTDSRIPPAVPASMPPLPAATLQASHEALRHGCGLADRSSAGRLELLGADRQRFLNAYVTCDVKGLAAGQGRYGLFPGPRGPTLADVVGPAHADPPRLEPPPGQEEAIAGDAGDDLIADPVLVRHVGRTG